MQCTSRCPLYPRKRRQMQHNGMSAKGHERTRLRAYSITSLALTTIWVLKIYFEKSERKEPANIRPSLGGGGGWLRSIGFRWRDKSKLECFRSPVFVKIRVYDV